MRAETDLAEYVLMAGAGVSMEPPSSLPGWGSLACQIANALSDRLTRSYSSLSWVTSRMQSLEEHRNSNRIPPDYQAQLIEEMAGLRYFQGLQSLDVTVGNENHEAIATFAQTGRLKAIVTTNFDRLIEQALERHGVPFKVALSDADFSAFALKRSPSAAIPIIKIHGCVTSPLSMIDTLKQRRKGRTRDLLACLDALAPARWIFAGFSAADIASDPSYLGFVDRAKNSPPAVYIKQPGGRLGIGAELLWSDPLKAFHL